MPQIGKLALFTVASLLFGWNAFLAQAAVTLNVDATTGTITTGSPCPSPRESATYQHIQAAVNCAESDDTLNIAAGTYAENVTIAKDLTLIGADAATTVVNGSGTGRVVTVDAAVSVELNDLTLTGGTAADGGGLYTSASSLTLDTVIISGNTATARGGGLFTAAGTVECTNCTVTGNSAPNGGGVFTLAGTVTFFHGSVTGNSALDSGGGVFTQAGTLGTTPGVIAGNTAATDPNVHAVVGAVIDVEMPTVIDTVVILQGRPAAPSDQLVTTLKITLIPQAGGAPVFDELVTTDDTGRLTVTVTPGAYHIRVKGTHTLARVVSATLVPGDNVLDVPQLLEGDANDDNTVNISDFSILAASFARAVGQAGYDARADFNGDAIVNISDFSLLASNFTQVGEAFP
ncbi:MAG: hypothetical protein IPK19_11070 [Chloroflexi bacterium]|nr:hypothetical protein [Chloroflexota bacterium]